MNQTLKPLTNDDIDTAIIITEIVTSIVSDDSHINPTHAYTRNRFNNGGGACEQRDEIASAAIRLNEAYTKAAQLYGYPDSCSFDIDTVPWVLNLIFETNDLHKSDQVVWDEIVNQVVWIQHFTGIYVMNKEAREIIESTYSDMGEVFNKYGNLSPVNASKEVNNKLGIHMPS